MQPNNNQSFFQENKTGIIISSIAIIIFIILLFVLFFNNKNTNNTNNGNLSQNSGFSFSNLFSLNSTNNKNSNNKTINNNNNTNEQNNPNTQIGYFTEGLLKVWSEPVAGYGFYYSQYTYNYTDSNNNTKTATDTKTTLIFVDSKTGYIYEKNLLDPTSTPVQITDSSYPNIYKAYFINDSNGNKSKVVMQYLDGQKIKSFIAKIPTYTGLTSSLSNITNLPDNVSFINTSSNNKYLVYIVSKNKTTNGKKDFYSDWYLINNSDLDYGNRIYTSELTDWKLNITSTGQIYAFNTDTSHEISNLYKLNSNNQNTLGLLNKIYTGNTGTSFLLNSNNIFISMNTGDGLKSFISNNNSTGNISLNNINFSTLSNKCALSDSSDKLIICGVPKEIKNYDSGIPDAWYQGFTSWDDNLYVINNDYQSGSLLFDVNKDASIFDSIDMKNLKINNTNSHLGFINKNDGSLWTLNIENILNPQVGD
ncbi:MAG: hypothetical protein WCO35_03650 [Candidatus Nomurabacteria bacterium]